MDDRRFEEEEEEELPFSLSLFRIRLGQVGLLLPTFCTQRRASIFWREKERKKDGDRKNVMHHSSRERAETFIP